MTNKIEKKLYDGEVNITFYPDSHRYKLEGDKKYLTSVTTITGIIDKSRVLINWAVGLTGTYLKQYFEKVGGSYTKEELLPIIDEACLNYKEVQQQALDIGSIAHEFAENFANAQIEKNKFELPENLDDAQILNAINGFLNWVEDNNVKFLETERLVYSKKHGYVGIFDAVAEIKSKKYIIEYKSSKALYPEYWLQASAYYKAYEEETKETIDGIILLKFGKEDGEFEDKKEEEVPKINNYFETFLACQKVKEWQKQN